MVAINENIESTDRRERLRSQISGLNEGYVVGVLENHETASGDAHVADVSDIGYDGVGLDPNYTIAFTKETRLKKPEGVGTDAAGSEFKVDTADSASADNGVAASVVEDVTVGELGARQAPGVSVDTPEDVAVAVTDQLTRVERLINAIRADGHHASDIDPLGLLPRRHEHLQPEVFGITPATLDASSEMLLEANDGMRPWLAMPTIGEAIANLRRDYCGSIGYEFDHIHSVEERSWLQEQVEKQSAMQYMSDDQKRFILELLTKVEGFEKFLHSSFPGKRWYSLEGLDALVVLIDQIVLQSAYNVRKIVMGMAHRGRLNVLAHVLSQPYESLLTGFLEGRFAHLAAMEAAGWMTDVKYHLGSRADVDIDRDGIVDVQMMLLPNPSHLEMVNPVVMGAVRSMQDTAGDPDDAFDEAMALLVHGDASFAGQGIVSESLNLGNLDAYTVGGAIHVIANNQLGFTTEPNESYSGQYSSDVARGYEMPVVHVNADDIEACALAAKMAVAYRFEFHKDFVIDLVGYRRHGHNENDEPRFTQPKVYQLLKDHPTLRQKWAMDLAADGVVTAEDIESLVSDTYRVLSTAMNAVDGSGATEERELPEDLGLRPEPMAGEEYTDTAVAREALLDLNRNINYIPEQLDLHTTVERVFERRREAVDSDEASIDWAHAEALALGSIMQDGIGVRLTGQDTARGTFSQRHAVVWDQSSGERYVPLSNVENANFWVYNSPLSEAAPIGFEHGYSVFSDDTLAIWEAQFGDFANNAQSVIDEMIASAQEKWGQRSDLVLLLPHGYEGQGPNHSHAHLERFLDLASNGNMRIAYPTTSAQYFHLLRTEAAMLKDPDKARPLVIMTPKSLLRHPMAASSLEELSSGMFRPIRTFELSRDGGNAVRRIVLCTGKVFVDLANHPKMSDADGIAIIVIEELYPFPVELIAAAFESFKQHREVVWLQEEPINRGAWEFVRYPLSQIAGKDVAYLGRPRSSSPASGSNWLHRKQQDRLIDSALDLDATL